jgi:hypothetical protein
VTESFSARHAPENPASTNQLMEEVCERENPWTGWFEIRRSRSRNIFGGGAHGLIAYVHAVHFNACRRPNCAAQRTANLSVRRRHPTLCLKAFLFQTTTVGATAPPTQPVALNLV